MNAKGLFVGFFLCVGLVVVMATNAFAVAGKMTGTPPGAAALAGGSVEVVLDEPVDGQTTFISTVGPNGEVNFPPNVDPNRGSTCRYTDTAGKTVAFRCGGYFAMGSSAVAASNVAAGERVSLLNRLADTWFVIQGGYSVTNGINSTSRGAFPGGATFLEGEGANTISAPSYNFMLQHPFDRFRSMLGGGAPYVFLQGSKFHGLDENGGFGVSISGFDRTSVNREISSAFGGGIGFSYPFYCYDGVRGGDKCFELGAFVGGKGVRQQVSATADEAGNLRSFQDCYTDVVPFGGLTAAAPLFPGVKFVFTYEIIALYSRDLSGRSFFNNQYDYRADGGTLHNMWGGVSINPGKLLGISPRWTF